MSQDGLARDTLAGMPPDIAAALRAPVPRTPAQVKLIGGRLGKFYRGFGLMMWSVVLLVPAVVGFTSPGEEWPVFFEGLFLTVLLFGIPTQVFVVVGLRRITAFARTGELRDAVVSGAQMRGEPGQQVADATMDLTCTDGTVAILRVSGLPTLPAVGTVYAVLADPMRPHVAGVIAPPVGIYIASAQPTAVKAVTRDSVQPAGEKAAARDSVMEYADLGLRCSAAVADLLVLLAAFVVVAVLEKKLFASEFGLLQLGLFLGAAFGYFIVMEAQYGWTLGKRALGLKMVTLEGGGPPSWRASIVRNLWRIVDGLCFYLVAVIAVLMSDKKQRIGDRVAGTVVVRAPRSIDKPAGKWLGRVP